MCFRPRDRLVNEPFPGNVLGYPLLLIPGWAHANVLQIAYSFAVPVIRNSNDHILIFFAGTTSSHAPLPLRSQDRHIPARLRQRVARARFQPCASVVHTPLQTTSSILLACVYLCRASFCSHQSLGASQLSLQTRLHNKMYNIGCVWPFGVYFALCYEELRSWGDRCCQYLTCCWRDSTEGHTRDSNIKRKFK